MACDLRVGGVPGVNGQCFNAHGASSLQSAADDDQRSGVSDLGPASVHLA